MDKSNLMFDLINKIRKVWRMTVEIFLPSECKQDSKSFSPETHEGLTSKGDVCPECDGAGIIIKEFRISYT